MPTEIPAEAAAGPVTIELCLVSHTNAGKTTLTRTLLGADVGEVRDAAHVTQRSEAYPLLNTEAGDRLLWWDTPGLGDSARLHRRLSQSGNPLGWFLSQVWDRWTDPAFFLGQRAMRSARDHADVVLYLVNASEPPQDAGHLEPELKILAWMDKPVVVLLNQLAGPGQAGRELAEVERWRAHLRPFEAVRAVLPLDAFGRCWVQEDALLQQIAPCLPPAKQAGHQRLLASWWQGQMRRFRAAMAAMAPPLLDAARPEAGEGEAAQRQLARRVAQAQARITEALLDLHGLRGEAGRPHWAALEQALLTTQAPVKPEQAGLLGAITSGAATGLGADLVSGGLSMGLGALVGAVVGAATFASAALAVNRLRGVQAPSARLSAEAWREFVEVALLTYLAVAHFGRGRGDFADDGAPARWRDAARLALQAHAGELAELHAQAAAPAGGEDAQARLAALLETLALDALKQLHPGMDLRMARQALAGL